MRYIGTVVACFYRCRIRWRSECNIWYWPSSWRAYTWSQLSLVMTRLHLKDRAVWRPSSVEEAVPSDSTANWSRACSPTMDARRIGRRTATGSRKKETETRNDRRRSLEKSSWGSVVSRRWTRRRTRSAVNTGWTSQKVSTSRSPLRSRFSRLLLSS